MANKLTGECLCGQVTFSLNDDFKAFFQCHCKQCQQLTGTAFASNLFTDPTNIEWLSGSENVTRFEHSTREFSKAFCNVCGSAVPTVNKRKTSLVVPAGSLNERPEIKPKANLFTVEEACWFKDGLEAKKFDGFPK